MEDFHLSNKNPQADISILTMWALKVGLEIKFWAMVSSCAKGQSVSKLYFKWLLHTKIVISMVQTNLSGTSGFLTKTFYRFSSPISTNKKVGIFWDGHSTNLPDSYKKWLLMS